MVTTIEDIKSELMLRAVYAKKDAGRVTMQDDGISGDYLFGAAYAFRTALQLIQDMQDSEREKAVTERGADIRECLNAEQYAQEKNVPESVEEAAVKKEPEKRYCEICGKELGTTDRRVHLCHECALHKRSNPKNSGSKKRPKKASLIADTRAAIQSGQTYGKFKQNEALEEQHAEMMAERNARRTEKAKREAEKHEADTSAVTE